LLLRAPKDLVGVAHYAGPTQLAHPVDDRSGLRAHKSEVTAVDRVLLLLGVVLRSD